MNSYNGFSPHQRMKAYRWLMAEYAAGRRTRPTQCDACTQTGGLIEPHSEDYSGPPFGDHIGQWGLCYACHMMIHCRFRAPEKWAAYRSQIRAGAVFEPIRGKNFQAFSAIFLRPIELPVPETIRPVPASETRNLLDAIDAGLTRNVSATA